LADFINLRELRNKRMALLAYRKVIERVLYVFALTGIGLTLHIALWYGEGGSSSDDPLCGVGSNCIGVIANDPAPLGIPSAWWGFGFYALIGLSCILITHNLSGLRNVFLKVRAAIVSLGWVYSLFLTILQATAIDGWCQLCLYSFTIVTLIAGFTFFGLFKRSSFQRDQDEVGREYIFHGAVAALLLGVLMLDYSVVSANQEEAVALAAMQEDATPSLCMYAQDSPPFDNLEQIVMDFDPFIGPEDAPILVMEFLDPNCNHCKAVHPSVKALAEAYPDSVRIVIKPVPIVGGPTYSLDEIAALYYANDHGVFLEMLDMVFEYQSPTTGLSLDMLAQFAEELNLNVGDFRRAIQGREYSNYTVQTRRFFEGMGFTGVPVIIINGQRISSSSRSLTCLKSFVEQAKRNI